MKKTLIALAVLAASTASMAQVTLYGKADVAVGAKDKVVAGTWIAGANDKFQAEANNTLTNGNSRFGLKGTEDLGGGLKANFNFEAAVNLAQGATDANTFQRAAWYGLSGGFGELRVGRQLNTTFLSVASYELTGTANYSVTVNQFVKAHGVRDNGAVMYISPSFGGFKVAADVVLEGNALYGTATDPKGKYDLSATYGAGPVVASLAYNKVDAGQEATVFGGSYNFGAVKVAGSWTQVKTSGGDKVAEGYTLGASLPMGAFTFTADVAQDTLGNSVASPRFASNDTDFLLEAKYALSKRTFVYAVYVKDGKGKAAEDVSAYSLGLQHNF